MLRAAEGLAGEFLGDAGQLEQDSSRLDGGDPPLGGALVNGRSGKMLIQTLPPRLMWRVTAIRAASIWRLVMYAPSSAWMP